MQPTNFPTFTCDIIFENEEGKEATQEDFSSLKDFFLAWHEGKIKRKVKIVEKEDGALNNYFIKDETNFDAAFVELTQNLWNCYTWLQAHLELGEQLLAYKEITPGSVASVTLEDLVFFQQKDNSIETAAKVDRVFIPSIPVQWSFEEELRKF